jgi:hypothetical protein
LDSFADKIKGMVKKIQAFLNQMMEYSTPAGIERVEGKVKDFADGAADQVTSVLMDRVDSLMDKLVPPGLLHTNVNTSSSDVPDADGMVNGLVATSDALAQVSALLTTLQSVLPDVVKNLKDGRKQVSAASKQMHSVFGTFKEKGPPIFNVVADNYAAIWKAYFALFAFLTVSVLFYGFWASGWFGGSAPTEDDGYERPQTFCDKIGACCSACSSCMRSCHDNHMCFWSIIIIMEVVVLLIFVVAIVLCIVAGVKAFVSAGCSAVYILGDGTICSGSLEMIQQFLGTFSAHPDRCEEHQLVTCGIIGEKLQHATMLTIVGSMFSAVLTFQMIIETAIMHERARWRRIFEEEKDA